MNNQPYIKHDHDMPKVVKYVNETPQPPPPPETIWSKLSKKELCMQLSFMFTLTYSINYFNMYNNVSSFVFVAITMDSLYSAIGFFRLHIFSGDLSQSQTLNKIKTLYTISLMDRYIYYGFLAFIHKSLCLLFWSMVNPVIFYACMVLCSPEIMDKFSTSILQVILARLNKEKFKITKIIVAKQLAHILNIMFYETVQMKPNLDYKELLPLLDNMATTLKLFYKFMSNFLVASIVHYVKTKNNAFYFRIFQLSYFYKTGTAVSALDEAKAKEEFVNTILLRKWANLLQPNTFQIIFYIYQNDKNNKFIDDIITTMHYTFIQICALWTMGNIFSVAFGGYIGNIIIPTISLLLLFYKYMTNHKLLLKLHIIWETTRNSTLDDSEKSELVAKKIQELEEINKKNLNVTALQLKTNNFFMAGKFQPIFPIISLIMGWYGLGLLTVCFTSECGYYIVCNKVMFSLFTYLYAKLRKFTKRAIHYNSYNRFIIAIILYIKLFNLLVTDPEYNFYSTTQKDIIINVMMVYNIIFQLTSELDQLKIFITIFLGIFSILSGYNNVHLIYLAIYLYFWFNLIDHFYPNSLKDFSLIKTISKILHYETLKERLQNSHNLRIFDSYYQAYSITEPVTK
jgi:hypothetical protein